MGAIADTVKILNQPRCCCGQPKGKGKAVCYICWGALTPTLRKNLYRHACDGFLDAYKEAVDHLKTTVASGMSIRWEEARCKS